MLLFYPVLRGWIRPSTSRKKRTGRLAVVLAKNAAELAEALVATGLGGFGDVGLATREQPGGVLHAQVPQVRGWTPAERFGKGAAEVSGALPRDAGQIGESDRRGEVCRHVGERG